MANQIYSEWLIDNSDKFLYHRNNFWFCRGELAEPQSRKVKPLGRLGVTKRKIKNLILTNLFLPNFSPLFLSRLLEWKRLL